MSDNAFVHRDAFNMLCDELIGRGMSRNVFSSKVLPDCVIKIEDGAGQFQNVIEWETWQRVKDTEASRWFAECRWISPNGSVLVMERTRTPDLARYPSHMPAFLCDFKRTNYGLSVAVDPKTGRQGSHFVCHDYGTHLMFENGMTKRMRKAEWWDA